LRRNAWTVPYYPAYDTAEVAVWQKEKKRSSVIAFPEPVALTTMIAADGHCFVEVVLRTSPRWMPESASAE